MKIGDINSVPETAYGFRTKLVYFIERIEKFRLAEGKEKREIKILDVGCGNGTHVTFPLAAQGYSVTGIDLHEPSIAFALKQNVFPNAHFLLEEVKNLKSSLAGEKFDVAILSDILEHVPHPQEILKDIKSLLSPHGRIFISIPNGYGPFEVENFILRKLGIIKLGRALRNFCAKLRGRRKIPYNVESGHIQFFTRKSFGKILHEGGFEVTDFRNACFLGGSVSNAIISKIPFLTRLNIKAARFVPAKMCSAWYFECEPKT